ncbi:SGNH/GDSL hydrolase family protein, partial [Streptomyces sp. YC537]|nr:SGNH/GDSL hydrolase family protein [Streptomyces boluensis]
MTRRNGYALLAALVAVVVLISAAIYVGVSSGDARDDDLRAGPRTPQGSA